VFAPQSVVKVTVNGAPAESCREGDVLTLPCSAGPPADVPEAGAPVLLPLVALLVFGLGGTFRRRRVVQRASSSSSRS
jgi:hypothetical protein